MAGAALILCRRTSGQDPPGWHWVRADAVRVSDAHLLSSRSGPTSSSRWFDCAVPAACVVLEQCPALRCTWAAVQVEYTVLRRNGWKRALASVCIVGVLACLQCASAASALSRDLDRSGTHVAAACHLAAVGLWGQSSRDAREVVRMRERQPTGLVASVQSRVRSTPDRDPQTDSHAPTRHFTLVRRPLRCARSACALDGPA